MDSHDADIKDSGFLSSSILFSFKSFLYRDVHPLNFVIKNFFEINNNRHV